MDQLDHERPQIKSSSYINFIIRKHRNQRRLRRHGFAYMLNHIGRLPPVQTNDPATNQFFNGMTFP